MISYLFTERYPDDFIHDDLTDFIIQDDASQYSTHHPIGYNLDFNTSVSSTSTGSYVDISSISDNHVTGNHIGINSGPLGKISQKAFASDSSSFHSSGSSHCFKEVSENQVGITSASVGNHSQRSYVSDSPSFHSSGSSHHYTYINEDHNNTLQKNLHQNPFYIPPENNGGGSSEISDISTTTSEDEIDPLKDIEPTINPVPNFDVSDYLPHNLHVEFIDLKNRIFEKQQSRKDKKARQRIVEGKVKIAVSSDEEVAELKVCVRREPQAATLCNDKNGDVELKKPTLLRHTTNKVLGMFT